MIQCISLSTYSRVSNNCTSAIKLHFILFTKKDNFMLLNRFKDFSINLNARHVNGMTPFDLTVRNTVITY